MQCDYYLSAVFDVSCNLRTVPSGNHVITLPRKKGKLEKTLLEAGFKKTSRGYSCQAQGLPLFLNQIAPYYRHEEYAQICEAIGAPCNPRPESPRFSYYMATLFDSYGSLDVQNRRWIYNTTNSMTWPAKILADLTQSEVRHSHVHSKKNLEVILRIIQKNLLVRNKEAEIMLEACSAESRVARRVLSVEVS